MSRTIVLTTTLLCALAFASPMVGASDRVHNADQLASQGLVCVTLGESSLGDYVTSSGSGLGSLNSCDSSSTFDTEGDTQCDASGVASWDVTGHYTSGSGTVKFWVQCDSKELVSCNAGNSGGHACASGEGDATAGTLHCYYQIQVGSPTDISGSCQDPVSPGRVIAAIELPPLPGLPSA